MFEDGGEGGEGEKREGNGRQVDAVRPSRCRRQIIVPTLSSYSGHARLFASLFSLSLCVGGRGGKRKERCSSPEGASNDRNVSLLLTDEKKKKKKEKREKEKSVP